MTTFILIPGAGGMASNWSSVVPLLEQAGHEALAIELPGGSETKGLPDYRDIVLDAIAGRASFVLVALSLGAFTAAMVCARAQPERLVFLNAMVPDPGETPGAWWKNTDQAKARLEAAKEHGYSTDFDVATYFLHDLTPEMRGAMAAAHEEAPVVFGQPCAFERWPDIPIRVVAGKDDRLFPLAFQRRIARERLNVPVTAVSGGHLAAVSNPEGVTAALLN